MNKFIILGIIFLSGCTQKYQTYHVIDKYNFSKSNPVSPITGKIYPGKKVTRTHCEGQIFFSSNAVTKTDRYLTNMLPSLCRGKNVIMNSRLTETWWTTILYSRSCVKFEGYCPISRAD